MSPDVQFAVDRLLTEVAESVIEDVRAALDRYGRIDHNTLTAIGEKWGVA